MMKRFIFGFQRRVWCPKWTPASSISFMVTTAMADVLLHSCTAHRCERSGRAASVVAPAPGGTGALVPGVVTRRATGVELRQTEAGHRVALVSWPRSTATGDG